MGLLEEAFKMVVEVEASAKATKAPGASSAAIAAPSHHLLSNATELHAKVDSRLPIQLHHAAGGMVVSLYINVWCWDS